jgi:hypothetical protein
LALAGTAGVLAWGIGERTHDYFLPSPSAYRSRDFSALNRELAIVGRKNAAVAFGPLGAAAGLFLGAAGGLGRRSVSAALVAGLMGLIVGGLAAGAAAFELAPVFSRFYSDDSPRLLLPMIVRCGIGAAVGAAAGLAFGLGRHGPSAMLRALAGGLIGAIFGIIAFEIVNAFFFPTDRNDQLIPTSPMPRLIADLCVALGAGAGAAIPDLNRPERGAPERTST